VARSSTSVARYRCSASAARWSRRRSMPCCDHSQLSMSRRNFFHRGMDGRDGCFSRAINNGRPKGNCDTVGLGLCKGNSGAESEYIPCVRRAPLESMQLRYRVRSTVRHPPLRVVSTQIEHGPDPARISAHDVHSRIMLRIVTNRYESLRKATIVTNRYDLFRFVPI
jgi:hypothetical protein